MWNQIASKYTNSVLQIKTCQAIYDPLRPYNPPEDKIVIGVGFIVDIEKGLILTCGEIVENAISISGKLLRTGKRELSIELIGICRERNIALCKIYHDDLNLITRGLNKSTIPELNVSFGDDMDLILTQELLTICYNTNIKSIIKSFSDTHSNFEDSWSRTPSYIQISGEYSDELIGSPVFNNSGKVIGLLADADGSIIPTRSILGIYNELLKHNVVRVPSLSLAWNNTNREIMKRQTGSQYTYGIYIRKVYPDSIFDQLQKGDVIKRIDYYDYFWGEDGKTNPKNFNLSELENPKNKVLVTVLIDRFGVSYRIGKLEDPTKYKDNEIKFLYKFTDRKMTLPQIVDMIPVGTELSLNLCRNGDWYTCKSNYQTIKTNRIINPYPRLEIIDYEIFAGLCCVNLDQRYSSIFPNINTYLSNPDNKYIPRVGIVKVFPNTSSYKTQILQPGQIIKSVLGFNSKGELIKESHRPVSNLDDIRHILRLRPDQIQITTLDDCLFLVNTSKIIEEDKESIQNFNINHKYLLE